MKINNHSSPWLPLFAFFIISLLTDPSPLVSSAPNDPQGTCVLNFTTYQYVPFGECGGVQEDITNWGGDGFPTTMCCRNALTVLSEAMAFKARISKAQLIPLASKGQLFISQDQFQSCSDSFHPQQGMSPHSCGFDNLYLGSSKCSNFALQDVEAMLQYQDALDKCAHFDHSFDESCANCTSAIWSLRDGLCEQANGKDGNNGTERAICGVAALVAVAAGKLQDDPSLSDKFLRCLPASSGGKKGRGRHLTWGTRVRILRDCSFALKYLHHHIEGCVVHRDIKLTNILLTEKYQAKLSDFGLAKMMGMEESKVFTDVRGTLGYMDPEYMSNAKLTCASDVYSFGIVALQILSGQKVIELDLDVRDQLTRKARDVSMGKRPMSDFEDPRLNGEVNKEDFEAILHIAVLCVAKSSKSRPTIEVVFDELDKVYKDTIAHMNAKQDEFTSTTSTSSSKTPKLNPR